MPSSNNHKQKQILQAACSLFLENGYAHTSLDAVAREAGVSKPTIYSHFKNKEALFSVIIDQICDEMNKAFAAQDIANFKPQEALMVVGSAFGAMSTDLHTVEVFRIVISESRRMPGIGRKLHAKIWKPWEQSIASYLKQQSARGTIAIDRPEVAARQFLGMLKEWFVWPGLLGLSIHFTAGERKRIVDRTVKTFLSETGSDKK